jgi:hypothetical protein
MIDTTRDSGVPGDLAAPGAKRCAMSAFAGSTTTRSNSLAAALLRQPTHVRTGREPWAGPATVLRAASDAVVDLTTTD